MLGVPLTIKVPGSSEETKLYRHVIAIPTAPAPAATEEMSSDTAPMP